MISHKFTFYWYHIYELFLLLIIDITFMYYWYHINIIMISQYVHAQLWVMYNKHKMYISIDKTTHIWPISTSCQMWTHPRRVQFSIVKASFPPQGIPHCVHVRLHLFNFLGLFVDFTTIPHVQMDLASSTGTNIVPINTVLYIFGTYLIR